MADCLHSGVDCIMLCRAVRKKNTVNIAKAQQFLEKQLKLSQAYATSY